MAFNHERNRCAFQELQCSYCSKCGQPSGVIQCCGCKQVFCSNDNKAHRAGLNQRLLLFKQQFYAWYENWTSHQSNQAKTLRKEQANLLDAINDWEETSTAAIRKTANEARQKVQQLFELRVKMPEGLVTSSQELIQRIEQAEKVDDFHELQLEQWTTALDCFRRRSEGWVTCFDKIEYTEPFIKKLIVREIDVSSSTHAFPDFHDIDGPPVVVKRPEVGCIFPDNPSEFQSGTHRFYFKARQYSFGIVSKYAIKGNQSGAFPIQYGWTADNRVYIDGIPTRNHIGYQSYTELGDNFMLEVDCERRFLHLRNQRTGQIYQINVDVQRCPLPWQLVFLSSGNTYRRSLQEF